MSEKMIATKFLRDETQIRQDWICLLMKQENVPLDVAYKANLLKIQKEYYPFAIFGITLEAKWRATSYWEHEEEYQVPREETVYIDYKGNEHKYPGEDSDVVNGHIVDRSRTPLSRTVYDTKHKMVVDNVEQTSGYVHPTKYVEGVWTGKGQSLLKWAMRFNDSQTLEVSQDYLKDYVLIPEEMTRKDAESQAVRMGKDDIGHKASHDVPGDRYEDMVVSSNVLKVNRTSYFLGVYHIFYEYEGKNYECLMCGGDDAEDVVLEDYPVDTSIKDRQDTLKAEIEENSKNFKFLIGAILLSISDLIMILGLLGGTQGDAMIYFIILTFTPGAVFCIYKYRLMEKQRARAEEEREFFNTSNTYLKQQIYDLIQNDSIPEEGKRETIEGWLRENERNWQAFDAEKANIQDDAEK